MSDTLHIVCVTCKTCVHVGQGGYAPPTRAYLYGSEEAQAEFTKFYDDHMDHDLRFGGMDVVEKFEAWGDEDDDG